MRLLAQPKKPATLVVGSSRGAYWTSDVITTGEEPVARTIELPEGYLDEYPTRFSAFFRGIKELE